MVWIPAGRFRMGDDHHYPEEAPAHEAEVAGFWMDRAPVTNAQFLKFVKATGHLTLAERPADPVRCRRRRQRQRRRDLRDRRRAERQRCGDRHRRRGTLLGNPVDVLLRSDGSLYVAEKLNGGGQILVFNNILTATGSGDLAPARAVTTASLGSTGGPESLAEPN